jgi:hypothetical protein
MISSCGSTSLNNLDTWDVLWISDSSGWGVAEIYGEMVAEDTGKEVIVHDYWFGTLAAEEVLNALNGDPGQNFQFRTLREVVSEAEIIVFFGNPIDLDKGSTLGDWDCTSGDCYVNQCEKVNFEKYTNNLKEIYTIIFDLRGNNETVVVAYDSYSAGVNEWHESGVFEECKRCWTLFNEAIYTASESYNVPVAQVVEAWNGGYDFLIDPDQLDYTIDGIHPNEKGARVIAEAVRALGYEPTGP